MAAPAKHMLIPKDLMKPEEFFLYEQHSSSFGCVNFSKTLATNPETELLSFAFGALKREGDKFWANVEAANVISKTDPERKVIRQYIHYSESEKEKELEMRKAMFAQ